GQTFLLAVGCDSAGGDRVEPESVRFRHPHPPVPPGRLQSRWILAAAAGYISRVGIRSIAALLGIVLCAALALTDEQAAQGSFPGRNGLIVFQSDRRFGGIEPWLISADGRGIKRLKGGGRVPAWSPDGRRIVS